MGRRRRHAISGTGSRGQAVERYVDAVAAFVSARSVGSIVDIGCGDFFVGGRLLDTIGREVSYLGLDWNIAIRRGWWR